MILFNFSTETSFLLLHYHVITLVTWYEDLILLGPDMRCKVAETWRPDTWRSNWGWGGVAFANRHSVGFFLSSLLRSAFIVIILSFSFSVKTFAWTPRILGCGASSLFLSKRREVSQPFFLSGSSRIGLICYLPRVSLPASGGQLGLICDLFISLP